MQVKVKDVFKLRTEVAKKGMSDSKFSKVIGRSRTCMHTIYFKGSTSLVTAHAISKKLGTDFSDHFELIEKIF